MAYFEQIAGCFGKLSRSNEGVTDSPPPGPPLVSPKRQMDRSDIFPNRQTGGEGMQTVDFIQGPICGKDEHAVAA